jgi:hypothetical protein
MTSEENECIEARFTEDEIKRVVFESYLGGGSGPDGISFMFYQYFWELIKDDLIEIFDDFHRGGLDIYRLNFALITIIP